MSNFRHGKRHTRVWGIWSGIVSRTTCETAPAYPNYGGRGITLDPKWRNFIGFYEDMGDPPDGFSLERVDNNAGYSKENCIWADRKTQNRNKRNNHRIEIDGVVRNMVEWSEISGIRLGTIWYRITSGWDPKDAVFLPLVRERKGIPRGKPIHSARSTT